MAARDIGTSPPYPITRVASRPCRVLRPPTVGSEVQRPWPVRRLSSVRAEALAHRLTSRARGYAGTAHTACRQGRTFEARGPEEPELPSAVFAQTERRSTVGRSAQEEARSRPTALATRCGRAHRPPGGPRIHAGSFAEDARSKARRPARGRWGRPGGFLHDGDLRQGGGGFPHRRLRA